MKNSRREKPHLVPLNKALVWILFSVLLVFGSATLAVIYYQHIKMLHSSDDAYRIAALIQTTPDQESLKTVYLAQLLDLSVDRPANLYRFSCKEARRKLLNSPLIKEAKVKKIKPGTIYVDYVLRKPVAFLADYTNTAIDLDGVPFPFKPFFTPKRLPEVYLGLAQSEEGMPPGTMQWGDSLTGKKADLARELMEYFMHGNSDLTNIRRIDVSRAYASSCGQCQIVIFLEEQIEKELDGRSLLLIYPRILRLNSKSYRQGLANYKVLRQHLSKEKITLSQEDSQAVIKMSLMIIDLRLPHLAYMSKK